MKILLADDHALFRAGLLHVLRQLDDAVEIIEASNCADALAGVETHPDLTLVLLDLGMPDGNGLAAIDAIAQRRPGLSVVVLSASESRADMQRALGKGALGFIPKAATPAVMLSALRLILAGGVYVPPQMIDMRADTVGENPLPPDLTPRRLEVLARAIEGKSYKTIARELGLAEPTVKAHVIAAYRALGVSNRMQAANKVRQLKIRLPTDNSG